MNQVDRAKRFELGKLFVGLAIPLAGLGWIVFQQEVIADLRRFVSVDGQPANCSGRHVDDARRVAAAETKAASQLVRQSEM